MRLINADELITAFPCGESIRTESVRATINHMPTIEQPTWVPCSERLPEEEGEYLVTAKRYAFDSSYYDVQIAYCSPNKKWFRISDCEILAWMPLPKPWKGAE